MKYLEVGIDSFAARDIHKGGDDAQARARAMEELLERMEVADQCGLDVFGIVEHYREEFLESAFLNHPGNAMLRNAGSRLKGISRPASSSATLRIGSI